MAHTPTGQGKDASHQLIIETQQAEMEGGHAPAREEKSAKRH